MTEFTGGFIAGVVLACLIWAGLLVINSSEKDRKWYECSDRMVIIYHSNKGEYDRKLAQDMVNSSGIWTNFLNQTIKMDNHRIEWQMENPK